MADIFLSEDIIKLLHNKFVVIIGDSSKWYIGSTVFTECFVFQADVFHSICYIFSSEGYLQRYGDAAAKKPLLEGQTPQKQGKSFCLVTYRSFSAINNWDWGL